MRKPSVKTLSKVFGQDAKQARKIFEMTRAELEQIEAGAKRVSECYHAPTTLDLRMTVLDSLGHSYGVEGFQCNDGSWVTYLNTGDTYTDTVCFFRGKYCVTSWGDIAEKHT